MNNHAVVVGFVDLTKTSGPNRVIVPSDDTYIRKGGNVWWRALHADHFESNEHVSESKFAEFWGSVDLGAFLHIPRKDQRK
jgi:hypothetical protein